MFDLSGNTACTFIAIMGAILFAATCGSGAGLLVLGLWMGLIFLTGDK